MTKICKRILNFTHGRLRFAHLVLAMLLLCTTTAMAQGEEVISVNFNHVKASEALLKVEKMTKSKIVFNYSDVKFDVTLNAQKKTAFDVIKMIVASHDLMVTRQKGQYILIKKVVHHAEAPAAESPKAKLLTGIVIADDGEPLAGATVSVTTFGKKKFVMTNENGKFEIPISTPVGTVTASYVGFSPRTLPVSKVLKSNKIVLESNPTLQEVVVTGYQRIDRRELTSSIAKIDSKDLTQMNALTVDQMLEGKAPGLMITNLSSTPGAAAKVRVRASGTFTGSREPLWVIDGIPYDDPVPLSASEINSFDQVNLIGNALTGINPQDIESINILKDASATAVYGTRAANGVIVITTKRGKRGKPKLSYSGTLGITERPHYSDFQLMNSKERVDVSREIYQRNLAYPSNIISYVGYEGALHDYLMGSDDFSTFQNKVSNLESMNTDWFSALYRNAISTTHNANISGGADNVKYYFSVGYNSNDGVERNVSARRLTARSNIDVDLASNLKLQVSMSGSVQNAKYNYSGLNIFNEAYNTSRAVPVKNEDGSLFYVSKLLRTYNGSDITSRYNILNEMENSERGIDNKDFNLAATLNWNIIPGIRFIGTGSYRNTTNITEEWIDQNTYYVSQLRTYDEIEDKIDELVNKYATVPFGGLYSTGHTSQRAYTLKGQINFNKVFAKKHSLNLDLGMEVNSVQYKGATGMTAPGYNHTQGRSFIAIPSYTMSSDGQISNFGYAKMLSWLTGTGSKSLYPNITDRLSNTVSYLAIFTYSFDNRYVFNFNMRSDGSNTFGQYEKYKFRPAWSVSGRWNIHNEKFIPKGGAMEELSLRMSYGFRGTSPSSLPYMIIRNYQMNSQYGENTSSVSSYPNANLTWEKTSTVNVGINHSWFNGRLSGSFDFAYSKGTDLLLSRPVSLVNGNTTELYNGGSKEDYSYEMDLRGEIIRNRHFGWSMNFNLTHSHERILKGQESQTLNVSNYLGGSIYQTGFPTDGFYSYQFDGLDSSGMPTFKNLTSGGTEAEYFSKVLTYSGRRTPTVYGGFGMEFRYRDFTLMSSFSYKLGQKIRRLALYGGNQNMPMPYENMSSEFINRWKEPGDEAKTNIPALSNDRGTLGTSSSYSHLVSYSDIVPSGSNTLWYMYDYSDARVVRGDFIRWQSLTLRYSVPRKWLSHLHISSAQMSAQVSNLGVWAFDKKLKGQDPEQVQSIGLPSARSFNFGLNISF